jgi:predicted aspartyl protease
MRLVFALTISLLTLLAATSTTARKADRERIEHALVSLKSAVNQDDFAIVEPLLDNRFAYGEHRGDMALLILRQVVVQFPEIKSIEITDVREEDDAWRVVTRMTTVKETDTQEFVITPDGRFLWMEIATIQIGDHGGATENARRGKAVSVPDQFVEEFDIVGKLVLVDAEVDGRQGMFIVDSGAPTLVLNSAQIAAHNSAASVTTHGATGAMQAKKVTVGRFVWGTLTMLDVPALSYDLSHLEDATGRELLGLIGYELIEPFEVELDYATATLVLTKLDADGNRAVPREDTQHAQTVAVTMGGHIPFIRASVGGETFTFGIDTGAGSNMLHESALTTLDGHWEHVSEEKLQGADGHITEVERVRLQGFSVGDVEVESLTFVVDANRPARMHSGIKSDGLLGYPWLQAQRTAMNFRKRELTLWR